MKQLLILILMGLSTSSFGGQGGGNGGLGFVCRDENRAVVSAELADFFESENDVTIGYRVQQSSLPWQKQYIKAIESLRPLSLRIDAQFFYKRMMSSIRPLPRGIGLVRPGKGEHNITVTHFKCPLEVIALHKEGVIAINQDIFEKLSETDKAGLYLHELLYWVGRQNKDLKTSDPVRPLVAAAFSSDNIIKTYPSPYYTRSLELLSFFGKGWTPLKKGLWDGALHFWAIYRENKDIKSKMIITSDSNRSFQVLDENRRVLACTDDYRYRFNPKLPHNTEEYGYTLRFKKKGPDMTLGIRINSGEGYKHFSSMPFRPGSNVIINSINIQPRIIHGDDWKRQ